MAHASSIKPLAELSTDDLVALFEGLGNAYAAYTSGLRDNGVDGPMVAEYVQAGTLDELFDELSITSKMHRTKLTRSFGTADSAPIADPFAAIDKLLLSHLTASWRIIAHSIVYLYFPLDPAVTR